MPQPKNQIVELYPQEGERQQEPWDHQCLHVPVGDKATWTRTMNVLAFMLVEARLYPDMPEDEQLRWLDQLQDMLRRPELLPRFLDEAGLTAVRDYVLAFFDPRQFASTSSTPPPKAA